MTEEQSVLNQVLETGKSEEEIAEKPEEAKKEKPAAAKTSRITKKKMVKPAVIPTPPFWGAKAISLPLNKLFEKINRSALYRITWGAGNARGEKWQQYQRDFDTRLEIMQKTLLELWLVHIILWVNF